MLTTAQLFRETVLLRSKVNPTAKFRITQITPDPIQNTLIVKARYDTLTDKSMAYYDVYMIFHGLPNSDKRTSVYKLGIEVLPGKFLYSKHPSFNLTPVMVSCMCKDYFFTAWYWNMRNFAHQGTNLPFYRRKTPPPPVGYPYRNPRQKPFCCKHIVRLAKELSKKGILMP